MNPDNFIIEFDYILKSLTSTTHMNRPVPGSNEFDQILTAQEKKHIGGLMRINHVGEVCAQALYQAQKLCSRTKTLKKEIEHCSSEESDHLAWCSVRLKEVRSYPSFLIPIWYFGSFLIGTLAGLSGDRISMGFIVEVERQVENHLDRHLQEFLPKNDHRSRAILSQMRIDEMKHAKKMEQKGGKIMPVQIKIIMKLMAKIMIFIAYKM